MYEYSYTESLSENPQKIITALRLIFWGTLICIIDVRIDQFDIVNNFIGMILMMCGVLSLSKIAVSPRYSSRMVYNSVAVVLATIVTFFTAIVFPLTMSTMNRVTFYILFQLFLVPFCTWGWYWFCLCMKEMCDQRHVSRCSASWRYSSNLIFFIFFIPSCIGFFVALCFAVSGNLKTFTTHHYYGDISEIGPLDLLAFMLILSLVVLIFWGMIHFLISLSRMIRAAENEWFTPVFNEDFDVSQDDVTN